MLKPALQLKLGQQLTMTPQLQQAIRLLQLPVLELRAQVQEALESNVMLEAEEDEQIDLTSLDQPAPVGEDEDGAPETTDEIVVEMEDPWSESSTPSGDGRAQDDDDRPPEITDDRERDACRRRAGTTAELVGGRALAAERGEERLAVGARCRPWRREHVRTCGRR